MRGYIFPNKGFTLIELLVTVTIIAVLSTMGLVLYNQFTKSARDAKRQSDLKFIQSALEDYHADKLYYPTSLPFGSSFSDSGRIYMKEVPKDPLFTRNYSYAAFPNGCSSPDCNSYCLYAQLEGNPPGSDPSCPPSAPYNFGVTRP